MNKSLCLLLILMCLLVEARSQVENFPTVSNDNSLSGSKIEVRLPASWKVIPEYDGSGFLMTFIDTAFLPDKKKCLDSAIFRLKKIKGGLAEAMAEFGFSNRGNGIYLIELNGYISIVVPFEISANNYVGLDCSFRSSIRCSSGKMKKGVANMRYMFFTNGIETVCLINNGVDLTEQASKELINTFMFK